MSVEINRSAYRPDIDGLRAVAVVAVVLFHAFPNTIKGGFVGVDIFFVISGFLITSIILKNLSQNSFGFMDFYSRRVKRIFPALIFVLISCLVFGWFALLPDEYKQLGKNASSGIGFVSNIVYWSESGYFDSSAELKPLLHLWSLGVEEQFYILFPLIIWTAWKLRLNILTIITGFLVVSFAFNVANVSTIPEAVFYLLPYRSWELVVGGILAYFNTFHLREVRHIKSKINLIFSWLIFNSSTYKNKNIIDNVFSIFGITLIAFSFYFIDETKRFPGWLAVIPVLGAAFVIAAGSDAWINRVILSGKAFVWVGLISFPLYLWHWPLLVFPRVILGDTPSILMQSLFVLISVALSWITFRFIERPLRHGRPSIALILASFGFIIFIAGAIIFKYEGFPNRSANVDSMTSQFGWNGDQKDGLCQKNIGEDSEFCRLSRDADPTILLIGDSISWQYYFGLEEQAKDTKDTVLASTQGGCAVFFGFSNRFDFDSCLRVTKKMLEMAEKESSIRTVIFSSFPRAYSEDAHPLDLGYGVGGNEKFASKAEFENHVDATFSGVMTDLIKNGKKIIFIKNNPYFTFDLKNCVSRPFRPLGHGACEGKYSDHVQFGAEYNELLDALLEKFPQISVFSPEDFICDKNEDSCAPTKKGKMLYRDGQHLSKDGSKYLGGPLYKMASQP